MTSASSAKESMRRFIRATRAKGAVDGAPLAAHPLTVHESAAWCDRLCRCVAARSDDARAWTDLIRRSHRRDATRAGDHRATRTDTAGAIDASRALDGLRRGQEANEQRCGYCRAD